jgi:hypothetical protein
MPLDECMQILSLSNFIQQSPFSTSFFILTNTLKGKEQENA